VITLSPALLEVFRAQLDLSSRELQSIRIQLDAIGARLDYIGAKLAPAVPGPSVMEQLRASLDRARHAAQRRAQVLSRDGAE
jgi:hypothetical protein